MKFHLNCSHLATCKENAKICKKDEIIKYDILCVFGSLSVCDFHINFILSANTFVCVSIYNTFLTLSIFFFIVYFLEMAG